MTCTFVQIEVVGEGTSGSTATSKHQYRPLLEAGTVVQPLAGFSRATICQNHGVSFLAFALKNPTKLQIVDHESMMDVHNSPATTGTGATEAGAARAARAVAGAQEQQLAAAANEKHQQRKMM